jgi:hypothetical protein
MRPLLQAVERETTAQRGASRQVKEREKTKRVLY